MLSVLGISLLSLVVSPAPIKSDFQWAHGLYQPGFYNFTVVARQVLYFLLYIGIVNLCYQKHLIIFMLKGYILGGVIAALVGLGQIAFFLLGKSTAGVHYTLWDPVPRILGTFNEPGPYSTFLATVIILLTATILFKINLFKKIALYGFWIIVSTALILTFSSRGLIEAVIGIVCLLLTAFRTSFRSIMRTLCMLGMVIIVLAIIYPSVFIGLEWAFGKIKAEIYLDPSEAYEGGRKAGLYIGHKMFLQNPLLGIGIGNYPFLRNEFADRVPTVSHLDLPNNVFLEFLAETGVFGFFAFLWFIVSIAMYVLKGYRFMRVLGDLGLAYGLTAACLVILIDLTVSSSLYFVYVWFLPSLLVALIRINKKLSRTSFQEVSS